jgi:hypothetical protein
MTSDPFVREKFTRSARPPKSWPLEYFERFPKDRYQTVVESWRHLQLYAFDILALEGEARLPSGV